MGKTLMILEVSRKQDYIFSSKEMRENVRRSDEIVYVTSGEFFQTAAPELYCEENMVFAGGGHTVLCFADETAATAFAQKISETALREHPGMELFIKQLPYDDAKAPGENLKALTEALEAKKSRRRGVFTRTSLGVEALGSVNWKPISDRKRADFPLPNPVPPPDGWEYPTEFNALTGKDNFIAVVHIDGNAMGKRVINLYAKENAKGWDEFRKAASAFSEGIQKDFETAFSEMAVALAGQMEALNKKLELDAGVLPLRKIILAGDDVCFVTAGSVGLECARVFLEKLSALTNAQDGKRYAACAGVALVHKKYPFHQAYDLAEQLCSSAKKYGAEINDDGRVSAMDWHIEFGQLKDGLAALREDYETEDGNRLELRPVTVIVPEGVDAGAKTGGVRTYDFFRGMSLAIHGEKGKTARGKIKDLREAFKQGEVESRFFMQDKEIGDLLYHAFSTEHGSEAIHAAGELLRSGESLDKEAFREIDGTKRCLYFDAIELIDHCVFFDEEVKA